MGMMAFTAMVFFIKLLRFNKRMGLLSATMKMCWDELSGFGMVFIVAFISFCMMFFLYLYKHMFEWRNFVVSLESTFGEQ